jgi:hypothetical protein
MAVISTLEVGFGALFLSKNNATFPRSYLHGFRERL